MRRISLCALSCLAALAAGCTFQLRDEGVRWGCGDFEYEINPAGAGPEQVEAVHRAVSRYVEDTGRADVFVGLTDDRQSDGTRPAEAPVLIEWFWPDDEGQPMRFAYAEPLADGDRYVGGFIYLHPSFGHVDAGVVEVLTMHELGHIGGLDDIDAADELMNADLALDDWGNGDRVGLATTHERCPA